MSDAITAKKNTDGTITISLTFRPVVGQKSQKGKGKNFLYATMSERVEGILPADIKAILGNPGYAKIGFNFYGNE